MKNRYSAPDHRIRLDYVMDAITRLPFMRGAEGFLRAAAASGIEGPLRPCKVLDLGCGETPIQKMPFGVYLGVDLMEEPPYGLVGWEDRTYAVTHRYLKANYEDPLKKWAVALPSFDLVLWLEGPEHTLKHDQVFYNIKNVLAQGGFLIITCPNERHWSVHPYHAHKCSFDVTHLRQMVKKNGFTILEIAEVNSRIREHLVGYDWLFCLATNEKYDPRYPQFGLNYKP